ncbi:MAG: nitroreductase, partial [Hydrogenophaga sp.]
SLTSGKALKSLALRAHLGLSPQQHAICFINLGSTASQRKPRPRPAVHNYLSEFGPTRGLNIQSP